MTAFKIVLYRLPLLKNHIFNLVIHILYTGISFELLTKMFKSFQKSVNMGTCITVLLQVYSNF